MIFFPLMILFLIILIVGLFALPYLRIINRKRYEKIVKYGVIISSLLILSGAVSYIIFVQPNIKVINKDKRGEVYYLSDRLYVDEGDEYLPSDRNLPAELLAGEWELDTEKLVIDFSKLIVHNNYFPQIVIERSEGVEYVNAKLYESPTIVNGIDVSDWIVLPELVVEDGRLTFHEKAEGKVYTFYDVDIPLTVKQFHDKGEFVDGFPEYGEQILYIHLPESVEIETTNDSYIEFK